ncbi:hypothetical protein [Fructilactobacillus frigidiflavus]|uniref:spr1630 family ClpXP-sensitive toxin n=1 Tax=Fructilactobacillus frigidiflavus TaxID=3242688 RepID=UPI003756EAF3
MTSLINNKTDYQLPDNIAKSFAQGIVMGNKKYAQERLEKAKKMKVSNGYAWARPNIIDDAISNNLEADDLNEMVKDKIAKAGYFWEYLQFFTPTRKSNEKALIIVKPGKYRPSKYGSGIDKKALSQNSIKNLMEVNKQLFNENSRDFTKQLCLFNIMPNELDEINQETNQNGYSRFYILAYTLNESSEVSGLKLMMPNPYDASLVEIQDLSGFIEEFIDSKLTDEQIKAISNDKNLKIAEEMSFYVEDDEDEDVNDN